VDRQANAGDKSLSASMFMGTMGSSAWGFMEAPITEEGE
jgi:hypothetical protein